MATRMAEKERVIVGAPSTPLKGTAPEAFAVHAAWGMWAGAAVMLFGSFIDLAVLWGLQFQPNPQWEFIASINTLEGYTRFAIGIAFVYAALYIRRSTAIWKYRSIAVFMLVLGLIAGMLGLVVLNDYFALARITQNQTEAMGSLVISVTKGVLLSGLFAVVFIPLGIMGLRRPRLG